MRWNWLALAVLVAASGLAVGGGEAARAGEAGRSAEAGEPSTGSGERSRLELGGAWHLLVHYRESPSDPSEPFERADELPRDGGGEEQWEDRIWRFEATGTRLRWTDYAVAIFANTTGRFQEIAGRTALTRQFWRPDAQQLEEIAAGLRTRSDQARTKTLRAGTGASYRSGGGLRVQSTSVIGYQEDWEIEALDGLPIFTQTASMSSGRSDDLEGRTQYRVSEIRDDGRLLIGDYGRDDRRRGRFELRRTGRLELVE
jgi:hypothetical protein